MSDAPTFYPYRFSYPHQHKPRVDEWMVQNDIQTGRHISTVYQHIKFADEGEAALFRLKFASIIRHFRVKEME
jgi:hypothetical protein